MTHRLSRLIAALIAVWGLLLVTGCATPGPDRSMEETRVGSLVLRDVPEIDDTVFERLASYQNTRWAAALGWVDDGLLITTRFGETNQLHRVDAPLGARRQITFFDEPVTQAWVSNANSGGFIYARDVGGSEFYQLFWYDWKTGAHRLLSDGRSRYGEVVWTNAGDRFAYYTTERNGRSRDVHLRTLDGSAVAIVEEDEGAWFPEDFSPADDRVLVSRYVSINESYLYEVDVQSGRRRAILDESLSIAIGQARYDARGTGVYFTSDMGSEFVRLHHLDLATGEIRVLTSELPWDVEAFVLSDDRSMLAFAANEDGISTVHLWRLPGHRPVALPLLPTGVVNDLHISADGGQLAISLSTATSPTDVWSLSIAERTIERWTRSEVGGLDTDTFAEPELVSYETFDRVNDRVNGEARRIPAFVFRPDGPGPHPVLILIHGGPEGQYRPRFSSTVQYLVEELGMAVIAPNVRGSAGYGKSYLKLDNGYLREDSVRDIGALIDWINTEDDLDPSRVVVMGGSYGGYMVLASLVHYSDRLAAGIESVGISNFVTFLTNTQPYRRDLRRAEYGDERDPDMRAHLEAISPLNNVEKITRPLMISQGANDPRVPASESEQIYEALKSSGIPVWYVLAEDEGHGFRKKQNRDYNTAVISQFLRQHVLN